jgi:hypothetical protein
MTIAAAFFAGALVGASIVVGATVIVACAIWKETRS